MKHNQTSIIILAKRQKKILFLNSHQNFFSANKDVDSSVLVTEDFLLRPFFSWSEASNTFLNRICSVHGRWDILIRNRRVSLQRFSYFCHVKYSELPISQPPDSQTSFVVHGPLMFILTLSIAPMFGLDRNTLASTLSMSRIEPCMLLKVNSGTRLMASDVNREYSSSQESLNRSVLLLQAS